MPEVGAQASPTDDVRVVAAIVEREGRFLLGRRPAGKRHAGLWEFPGGKIREGETVTTAVTRELAEELSMQVVSVGRTLFVRRDGDAPFVIEFVEVEAEGTPESIEHDEVDWHGLETMAALPLAPADAAFVAWLRERDRGVPIRRRSPAP